MKTEKMSWSTARSQLSKEEMKRIMAGSGDDGGVIKPICKGCLSDSDCDSVHVCRFSYSCMNYLRVCAKPIYV